jgi:hypothetical protein
MRQWMNGVLPGLVAAGPSGGGAAVCRGPFLAIWVVPTYIKFGYFNSNINISSLLVFIQRHKKKWCRGPNNTI